MDYKQTLVILGSGLMVLGLATAAAFFIFSPSSTSAGVSTVANSSNLYDEFKPLPNSTSPTSETTTQQNNTTSTQTNVPGLNSRTLNPEVPGVATIDQNGQALNSTSVRTPSSIQNMDGIQVQRYTPDSTTRSADSLENPQGIAGPKYLMGATSLSQQSAETKYFQEYPRPSQTQPTQTTPAAAVVAKTSPKPVAEAPPKKTTNTTPTQKTTASTPKRAENRTVKPGYWIQLASYSSLRRAKGVQEDLKRLGLNTSIEVSNLGSGKLVYRVKAGAWSNEKEAKSFLENFRTAHQGFSDAFVVNSGL